MKFLDFMLSKLTDRYNKSTASNIGKLFRIVSDELEDIKVTINMIERYRDIDGANGFTLDRIGRNVLQSREQMNDEDYRQMIKTKIRANLSPGDIETIVELASVFVGEHFVGVQEMWMVTDHPAAGEDAAVLIRINKYDELKRIPYAAMKRVAAGGVRVYFQVIDSAEEISGWEEELSLVSYACPVPSEELYPSEDLYPC